MEIGTFCLHTLFWCSVKCQVVHSFLWSNIQIITILNMMKNLIVRSASTWKIQMTMRRREADVRCNVFEYFLCFVIAIYLPAKTLEREMPWSLHTSAYGALNSTKKTMPPVCTKETQSIIWFQSTPNISYVGAWS